MGGLKVKYAELFSLSLEQPFYENNVYRKSGFEPDLDFKIIPSLECEKVMKRMDLVFRNTNANAGFVILGRVLGENGSGDDLLRFPARAGDKLTFLVLLKNPQVLSSNELPVQLSKDVVYYFSNNIADLAAPRNSLHLTKDNVGVKWPDDSMKIVSDTYRYQHNSQVVAGTAQVRHLLTGVGTLPKSIINAAGKADLMFDLFSLPSGLCQLLVAGVLKDEFYYKGQTTGLPVFGVIELQLSSITNANYRMIEPDRSLTPQRPLYKIVFPNRKTLWRYTVQFGIHSPLYLELAALTPAEKADFLNRINIVSNDTNIIFNKSSATDTSFEFVSTTELALKERNFSSSMISDPLNLKLKKYIGEPNEASVKTDLPYASNGTLNAIEFPIIYSDIFITL
ncbi:MAG: hypothetical protein JWQ40_4453 [Segetibacter sp.]|nr:hypothetical protein [Segetibacter sp.]